MRKKVVLFLLITMALSIGLCGNVGAITYYDVDAYDDDGDWQSYYYATDQPGSYYIDTVITSTLKAGYTSSQYKATGLSGSTPIRVRFRDRYFDPRSSSNYCGNGYSNLTANVTELQCALMNLNYLTVLDIDGIWGPVTRSAVISFQSNNGLTADGIVGPNTWKKLASDGVAASRYSMVTSSISTSASTLDNSVDVVKKIILGSGLNTENAITALRAQGYTVETQAASSFDSNSTASGQYVVGFTFKEVNGNRSAQNGIILYVVNTIN